MVGSYVWIGWKNSLISSDDVRHFARDEESFEPFRDAENGAFLISDLQVYHEHK